VFRESGARAQAQKTLRVEDLDSARKLFADALRDEEDGDFVSALEKFERVRNVRDTASIEYRIGTCYEGLGRPASALVAYRSAVGLGESEPESADVVHGAQNRMHVVAPHTARLALRLSSVAPADADVRIDDVPLSVRERRAPVPLDPGKHVVTATAAGAIPYRAEINAAEGDEISLQIPLDPRPVASDASVRPAASAPAMEAPAAAAGATPPAHSATATIGWSAIIGGSALLVASAVVLLIRDHQIGDLNRSCPMGRCPAGVNENAIVGERSAALAEGPVGVAIGTAGLISAAVGAYFLLSRSDDAPAAPAAAARIRILPLAWRDGAGAVVVGAL
jgi:hypothetical protein